MLQQTGFKRDSIHLPNEIIVKIIDYMLIEYQHTTIDGIFSPLKQKIVNLLLINNMTRYYIIKKIVKIHCYECKIYIPYIYANYDVEIDYNNNVSYSFYCSKCYNKKLKKDIIFLLKILSPLLILALISYYFNLNFN